MANKTRQQSAFSRSSQLEMTVCPGVGHGFSIGHHGEILQGVFEDSTGRLRRGLVSLLSEVFKSEATFIPNDGHVVQVEPAWKIKALRAAEVTLAYIGQSVRGGRLKIRSNILPSWGFGSSTSDVTATTRAVADAFGIYLTPREIAKLVVQAEIASDPLMFTDRVVLFAQRDGVVIEEFARALPAIEVLGFNTDPNGVDTLNFQPARYSWWEIEAFRPLLALIRRAVYTQEPSLIGQAALASARINQRHLPKPRFDQLEKLVEDVGAIGLQVAHSGTLVGLLFDPADPLLEMRIDQARASLAEMKFDPTWRFTTESEYELCSTSESIMRKRIGGVYVGSDYSAG